MLFYLSQDVFINENIVFRGGTALKKIYFPEYRFSEDLDFVISNKDELSIYRDTISRILQRISSEYPIETDKRNILERDKLQLFITFDIIPDISGMKELKVDILRDDYIPKNEKKIIKFSYPDFKGDDLLLRAYILESIVCDKIGRIMDVDNEPRDLFDLWYLLQLGLDVDIINNEYKNKYGYNIIIPNLISQMNKSDYRNNWKIRLSYQMKNLPEFDLVNKDLNQLIKENSI
ncbi:MAG: nucleotidyl transferase AbiEii/AbiGii toxin family protein [Candidatus Delongbacteria bacterium]|nr:nucleotidyl transferase AbiEii/AbiGii toxin family protein [Candidatus Delongbacteria bacterium]